MRDRTGWGVPHGGVSENPEYGIEIYRCDLLHRLLFDSKFNQNFNIPLGSTMMQTRNLNRLRVCIIGT